MSSWCPFKFIAVSSSGVERRIADRSVHRQDERLSIPDRSPRPRVVMTLLNSSRAIRWICWEKPDVGNPDVRFDEGTRVTLVPTLLPMAVQTDPELR